MATDRSAKYRQVELVLHVGAHHHVGALFASQHGGGTASRRLLARAVRPALLDVSDLEGIISVLRNVLDELEAGRFTPPR
jgi:hypothetical protein